MQTPAQVIESFQKAWENHDANALGALFVEDAEFINVFGEHLHGRQQIVTEHAMTLGASQFCKKDGSGSILLPTLLLKRAGCPHYKIK